MRRRVVRAAPMPSESPAILKQASSRVSRETLWRLVGVLEWCPPLYVVLMRRLRPDKDIVDRHTDVVIEGYQSSANSFARRAMKAANPDARVASHLHSWAHVAYAVILRKPVIVVLRHPDDAIASRIVRFGLDDARRGLISYATFYRGVKLLKSRCVLVPFAEVTDRYGDVIRRVNDTYGTSFVPFDHDNPEAIDAVFAELERNQVTSSDKAWGVAMPVADRTAATAEAKTRLAAPEFAAALARCRRLYDELLAAATERSVRS